jgi:hypothetical protein
MSEFYLVRDGQQVVSLAAERDGKLYTFVPNVSSFVYNKPMSVDFQIDRRMDYEPVSPGIAAGIVRDGSIGEIDENANQFLLDHVTAERRRIDPNDILDAGAGPELSMAGFAGAVADFLLNVPLGRWVTLGTYPRAAGRVAIQLASDLREGLVQAFGDIPMESRLRPNADETQTVEVRRTRGAPTARIAPSAPRKATKKSAAKKAGVKVPVKAARQSRATAARAKSR